MSDFLAEADELQLMTGVDIPIEGLGITIRQPKVKDISMLGETNYFIALQIFLMDKKQLKIDSPEVDNWKIFQQSMSQKIEGIKSTRALLTNFLQLFFINQINIGPRSLMITANENVVNIESEDFDKIQSLVGSVGGKFMLSPVEEKFKPKNKMAQKIAEKMKKMREKVARVKAIEQGRDLEKHKGFLTRYIKTVAVATSNSLEQVNNMTLFQLNEIMQGYLAWEAYDLDVKSRLAGATTDKELVHWTMADDKSKSSIGTI